MKLHLSALFCLVALITTACEKTHKIIETRQASPEIRESFKNPNVMTVSLETSALGKVFLMIANSKTTGNQSAWIEHPVKLITFERSGAKIGIFEVGYDQIYDVLESQKLLQTLDIISETPESLSLDIQNGLRITGEEVKLGRMKVDPLAEAMQRVGYEEGIRVKDVLVKQAELVGNRLQISQKWRLQGLALTEESSRVKKVDSKEQKLFELETSYDTRIEISPYVESETFFPKEQDRTWSLGSFVTWVRKMNSSEPEAVALRWDTSVGSPIRYIITGNTPEEVIPYIKEGLEYWNRVAGRTILQVEVSPEADVEPQDRAVIVRWIPWRDAGYAYAGMQFNPMTGEIYRGQIFLTSSWLMSGGLEKTMSDAVVTELPQGACQLNLDISENLKALEDAVQDNAVQARMDYFRSVVAHESGHTLGMRHHFAAASQVKDSFEKILEAREAYTKNPAQKHSYPNFSLSVMDYNKSLDSAIVGNALLEKALPYDKDFIDWSYNEKEKDELESATRGLCTDDHLMYAAEEGISIFGCGAFKPVGEPLLAALEAQESEDLVAILNDVESLLYSQIKNDGSIKPIVLPKFFFGLSRSSMQRRSSNLDNYMFMAMDLSTGAEQNVLLSQQSVTSAIINGYGYGVSTDYSVTGALAKSMETALEKPVLRSYLLPVDNNGELDPEWLKKALEKMNFKKFKKGKTREGVTYEMTDEQFKQFEELVHTALRGTFKEKLNLSLRRLLVDREALINSLASAGLISDRNVALTPRSWVGESKLKPFLKNYVSALLQAVLGQNVIGPELSKDPGSHSVNLYAVTFEDFEKLRQSLSDSGMFLGVSLASIAEARELNLFTTLAGTSVRLSVVTSSEDMLRELSEALEIRTIEPDLHDWAVSEVNIIKAMRAAESL